MEKQIVKVYSGKMGCMCGCNGKWSYTAQGAAAAGYGDVNERSVKIIAKKVLQNENKQVDGDCVYTEEDGRIRAVYFA